MSNETKILKSDTFEEWRHGTNEISFDVGGKSELDDRLTNKLFSYNDVSGFNQNIVTGVDNSTPTQILEFELLPDTMLDNTSGYIILAHGTSLTGITNGNTISQSGGFLADITSSVTIDGKPKILVRNATGTFNASQNLTSAATAISSSSIVRLVTERYNTGSLSVKTKAANGTVTELPHNMSAAGYHVPNVSGKINLDTGQSLSSREAAVDVLVEGEIIYQNSSYLTSLSSIEDSATFYGTVYHASPTAIYVKVHTGTYNSNLGIKILNYNQASGQSISNTLLDAFDSYSLDRGHFVELNDTVTAQEDVTVSARALVDTINELQDDVGRIEDLQTNNGTDLTVAINELELAIRGTSNGLVSADLTSTTGAPAFGAGNIVSALKEHEVDLYGASKSLSDLGTNDKGDFVLAINELETAIRGTTSTLVSATLTTTASDITSAINEHDTELGSITATDMGTTASTVSTAIKEHEDQIGNVDITGIDSDTDTITGALVQLHDEIGDVTATNLGTTASNLTAAIKEHEDQIGNMTLTGLDATDLSAALRELRTDIGDVGASGATLTTTATDLTTAVNELDAELGSITATAMDTVATTVSGAIAETRGQIGVLSTQGTELTTGTNITATNIVSAIIELDATIGSGVISGTDTEAAGAASLTAAINSIDTGLGDADSYNDGTYGTTTVAGTLELLQTGVGDNDTDIGNLMSLIDGATTVDSTISFQNLTATSIKAAIEEMATSTSTLANSAFLTADSSNSNSTLVQRNASGDVLCRLLRPEYTTTNAMAKDVGYIMTQTEVGTSATDNYIRPATSAQIRTFLNVPQVEDVTTAAGVASSALPSTGGTFTGNIEGTNTTRDKSVIGSYNSNKTDQIWAIGSSYLSSASGTDFGNLIGLAYKHTNNATGGTMAGSHQMVWCHHGTPKSAMGENIWTGGTVYANSFIYNSDRAFKENIKPIENALDTALSLNGVTYNLKKDGKASIGFIAQEVEDVLPELVDGEEGTKGVNYGQVVAVLTEAMKEQQEQINLLRQEIEDLKNAIR